MSKEKDDKKKKGGFMTDMQKRYAAVESWMPWKLATKAKSAKCTNCKKTADVYCVDCKRELCLFCTTLLHHPDTKFETHSLEDIVKEDARPEVKIISPILLELILIAGGFFFFSGTGISPEYFSGESYCPGLGRVRYMIARFDANIFFYFKNELAQYCDWEDSYWRFFMDTWIRSVLTNTDSWILLIASFVKAVTFEEFLRIIITPVVANLYAVLAYIVRSIEFWMHKIFYEHFEGQNHTITKVLDRISKVVQSLRFADKLGIHAKLAPPTHRRKRQATDVAEYFDYMWRRRFRLLEFYQAQAHAVCNLLLKGSLIAATLLRVLCIFFSNSRPLTPFLEAAHFLGLGTRADRHLEWFTDVTGTPVNHGKAYYWTDRLAGVVGREVLASIPLVRGYMSETASVFWKGAMNLGPLALRPLLPIIAFLVGRFIWGKFIEKQQKAFDKQWKAKYCKEIWGDMSRENPCGGVEYKNLKFSEHPPKAANGRNLHRMNTTMIES